MKPTIYNGLVYIVNIIYVYIYLYLYIYLLKDSHRVEMKVRS